MDLSIDSRAAKLAHHLSALECIPLPPSSYSHFIILKFASSATTIKANSSKNQNGRPVRLLFVCLGQTSAYGRAGIDAPNGRDSSQTVWGRRLQIFAKKKEKKNLQII